MNNRQFLQTIRKSFITFLNTHPRSNKKLIVLHGAIAGDIKKKLGKEYEIKSLGLGNGKEGKTAGRYMDKTIDILISKNKKDIAGIGVKFVMNNYSQNSNNYFENMLGETANIRTSNKEYFQILILPEEMPYYTKGNAGKIIKWEKVTNHNIEKYIALSRDNIERYFHTPVKTLLFIIKIPKCNHNAITTRVKYREYYLNKNISMRLSENISGEFGNAMVLNDYEVFIEKIVHYIKSI